MAASEPTTRKRVQSRKRQAAPKDLLGTDERIEKMREAGLFCIRALRELGDHVLRETENPREALRAMGVPIKRDARARAIERLYRALLERPEVMVTRAKGDVYWGHRADESERIARSGDPLDGGFEAKIGSPEDPLVARVPPTLSVR